MYAQRTTLRVRARRLTSAALLVALLGLVAAGVVAVLSGRYQVRPVLSGSMRPGLPVGGVVITHRVPISALRVRDVVVFHRPDQPQNLVVHRIIALTRGPSGPVVETQGDANDTPDPWQATLSGKTAYRAAFSVPMLGYAVVWAHGPVGRLSFLVVGLLLVVGAAGSGIVASRRRSPGRATQSEVLAAAALTD